MSILASLVGPVTGLLDKFIEDKDTKNALAHEIATMSEKASAQNAIAQIELNKAEAYAVERSDGLLKKNSGGKVLNQLRRNCK